MLLLSMLRLSWRSDKKSISVIPWLIAKQLKNLSKFSHHEETHLKVFLSSSGRKNNILSKAKCANFPNTPALF